MEKPVRRFSNSVDYSEILAKLRDEFMEKFTNCKPSNKMEDFKFEKVLGKGAFGIVKLVLHEPSGKYYATKILEKEKIVQGKQLKHTLNEKQILTAIRFPFLVNMEFSFKDNLYIYLVMPFVNGGEMFTHWRNAKKFKEPQAKFYAAQVVLAFEYLHFLNLVYRDLKPENIMIDSRGYIKITDFGFCKFVEGRTYTFCGTPEYLAPEIILSKGYGKSVDWWSFGILLYELVAGYSPFYAGSSDQMALFSKIVKCRYRMSSSFGVELRDLIKHLLQSDISRRLGNLKNGPNDIKNHAWLKETNWIGLLNQEIEAPFIPNVSGDGDSSQFDKYDDVPLMQSDKCKYEEEFADF